MENADALWTQEYCDNEIHLVYSRIDILQISLVQVNRVVLHVERPKVIFKLDDTALHLPD